MATLSGGKKLVEALNRMAAKVKEPAVLRVGFLEGARYPDGTPVAMIAAIQDFGAPSRGIPPRPFFRNMIADKSPEWPNAIATLLKHNDFDAKKTLMQTGEAIAGQLRESITTFVGAPLKPATIRRKGSEKQLVDSGVMLASVDFEVKI